MGIRQTLHQHPAIAAGITACAILIVTASLTWRGGGPAPAGGGTPGARTQAFFSVDDGKTYFADDARKIPPFKTTDGKTACRARVFRCGDGPPFVGYLERFNEADRRRIEAEVKRAGDSSQGFMIAMGSGSTVIVKKPGTNAGDWIKLTAKTEAEYLAVVENKCPDGSTPTRVMPE